MGVSQRNLHRLLASLHSISKTHIQNLVLIGLVMTVKPFELLVDNTGIYLGIMLSMGIVSFCLGLLIGFVWLKLL
jgi:hypothetical protein